MRFDEHWTGEAQQQALRDLAAITADLPGEAIEIGTHQGLSAMPIANAIYPSTLHVVDHWRGSSDMPPESKTRGNYSIFLDNMEEGTLGNFTVHFQDWREFAQEWNKPIRFIYLDAEHTQWEVSDQISAFLPFIRSGIIAGDDYGWTGVQLAVRNYFPEGEIHTLKDKLWWVYIHDH